MRLGLCPNVINVVVILVTALCPDSQPQVYGDLLRCFFLAFQSLRTNLLQMLHHNLNAVQILCCCCCFPSRFLPPSLLSPWHTGIRSSCGSGFAMMSYRCHLRGGGEAAARSQTDESWELLGAECASTTDTHTGWGVSLNTVLSQSPILSLTHICTHSYRGEGMSQKAEKGVCGSLCPYMGSIRLGVP